MIYNNWLGNNHNLFFAWVLGHVGIEANVLADRCTRLDDSVGIEMVEYSWKQAVGYMDTHFKTSWNPECSTISRDSTRQFIPTPTDTTNTNTNWPQPTQCLPVPYWRVDIFTM